MFLVPSGGAGGFLAPLPIASLEDPELAGLLARLGVQTLGEFAAMEAERVRERFGERGIRLHALSAGRDSRAVEPRVPPPELHREVVFEPPLEIAEQVAFGMRMAADAFIAGLGALDLVCTELRVELTGDRGEHSERVWLHPGSFDAAAVVDRVRWQLGEDAEGAEFAASPRCASSRRRWMRHAITLRRSSARAPTNACITRSRACRRCSGTAGW